ncbi:axoneme-associated protein mst101(3)-like [Ambystoma mexicanum]|uniref:axoneme-associated protein mst101(3)-like n=1 Tax=Ambystoma mexicanum TaxID=8296 RepID=UPI0037E79729
MSASVLPTFTQIICPLEGDEVTVDKINLSWISVDNLPINPQQPSSEETYDVFNKRSQDKECLKHLTSKFAHATSKSTRTTKIKKRTPMVDNLKEKSESCSKSSDLSSKVVPSTDTSLKTKHDELLTNQQCPIRATPPVHSPLNHLVAIVEKAATDRLKALEESLLLKAAAAAPSIALAKKAPQIQQEQQLLTTAQKTTTDRLKISEENKLLKAAESASSVSLATKASQDQQDNSSLTDRSEFIKAAVEAYLTQRLNDIATVARTKIAAPETSQQKCSTDLSTNQLKPSVQEHNANICPSTSLKC